MILFTVDWDKILEELVLITFAINKNFDRSFVCFDNSSNLSEVMFRNFVETINHFEETFRHSE